MPLFAVIAVLLASVTHATWNLCAKRAAGSRHFVWMYSVGSVALYLPIVLWILIADPPHWGRNQWLALCGTSVFHLGRSCCRRATGLPIFPWCTRWREGPARSCRSPGQCCSWASG
jgi:drug/metabolite transporter (DMT)-like permease